MRECLNLARTISSARNLQGCEEKFPGGTMLVDYCPGNGTRYVLVVTDLTSLDEDLKLLGRDGEKQCHQIAWMNGGAGKAITIGGHDFLHYSYVRNKFQCSEVDAVVLAELIGYLVDRPAMSCEEYIETIERG